MRRRPILLALTLALLCVFAGAAFAQTARPNGYAWVKTYPAYLDGEKAELIFLDVSNPVWARLYDINYAPRLGLTADDDTDDIYFVANFQQWPVIEPEMVDGQGEEEVSPLHKIHLVRWVNTRDAYPLTSSDDVEEAETLGLVTIADTEIVLNAPVVVWPAGWQDYNIIPQAVTAGGSFPFRFFKGYKFIKLPVYNGYVRNKTATFLLTDVWDDLVIGLGFGVISPAEELATEYGANYYYHHTISHYITKGDPTDVLDVRYRFLIEPPCWEYPRNQWSVYGESVSPTGWRNSNWRYSPFREHFTVDRGGDCSNVYRNVDLVELLINNGTLSLVYPEGDAIVNSSTLNIPSGNVLK